MCIYYQVKVKYPGGVVCRDVDSLKRAVMEMMRLCGYVKETASVLEMQVRGVYVCMCVNEWIGMFVYVWMHCYVN